MNIIIRLVVQAIAVFITSYILPGVSVADLYTSLIVALVLGLVNTFIKPLVLLFTLPLNIMTLGLFSIVINAFLILLVDYIVKGFAITNFWWAILFAIVLSFINWILNSIVE